MSSIKQKTLSVAIVGSCQVAGLGVAIRALLPGCVTKEWHVGVHPLESPSEILAQLSKYDVVVSQLRDGEPLGIKYLSQHHSHVVFIPVFVFRGFHPDCVYLYSDDHGHIRGPLGETHSAIIAACYLLRLPARRVPGLFNSLVFGALGYYDVFRLAREHVLERFNEAGFQLQDFHIDSWIERTGAFMYAPNHPNITVLAKLAEMALQKAQLMQDTHGDASGTVLTDFGRELLSRANSRRDKDADSALSDPLQNGVQWPTYPELAKRLGIPGGLTFKRQLLGLQPGGAREISLSELVEESYQCYDQVPIEHLRANAPADLVQRLSGLISRS